MASAFKLDVHGVKELDRALSEMPERIQRKLVRKGLRESAKEVQKEALTHIPKGEEPVQLTAHRSGVDRVRLGSRRAVKVRSIKRSRKFVGVTVTARAPHAAALELGTETHQPVAYMRRATSAKRLFVLRQIGRNTRQAIRESMLKNGAKP